MVDFNLIVAVLLPLYWFSLHAFFLFFFLSLAM